MTIEVYARTAEEIRSYRVKKYVVGLVTFLGIAVYSVVGRAAGSKADVADRPERIVRRPVVTTDDAMRGDFPLRWSGGRKNALRKVGKHSMFGVGPPNAEVYLFEGEKEITRARSDARGRWKAQIAIAEPGVKTYRADFRRGGVAAGRSMPLAITLVDPASRGSGDVSITNLTPNDRVVAGAFTLRGSAPAGDFVQIYVDATQIGRAEVDLAGRWSFKPKLTGGGRRTFTVVDEITQDQFGPLPVFVVGKAGAARAGQAPPRRAPGARPAAGAGSAVQSAQGTPLR